LLAGFVPAWMIVRQNTLNSILGRKWDEQMPERYIVRWDFQ
jgi:hypothetical protein